jgi:hypothetical protein
VQRSRKIIAIFRRIQTWIAILLSVLAIVLCTWAFPVTSIPVAILAILLLVVIIKVVAKQENTVAAVVTISVLTAAFVNVLLNGSLYPGMLRYQGGSSIAAAAKQLSLQKADTYIYNIQCFAFDFYTGSLHPIISLNDIKKEAGKRAIYVLTNDEGLNLLKNAGIQVTPAAQSDQYHLTKLKLKFVNPATRKNTLDQFYLLRVNH